MYVLLFVSINIYLAENKLKKDYDFLILKKNINIIKNAIIIKIDTSKPGSLINGGLDFIFMSMLLSKKMLSSEISLNSALSR